MQGKPYRDFLYTTQEGLRLYARDYGERTAPKTPVICLPGLTRNSKDFDALAVFLSHERRVLCPDLRGRGRSEYVRSADAYTAQNEMMDTFDLMAAAGIHQAVFIGTSRGGIITILMAAYRPVALKAAILNDIGPVIEAKGLERIAGYAGTMETPATWDEAAVKLRMMNERDFPNVTGEEWRDYSRRTFATDEDGNPKMDYDPKIGTAMRKGLDAAKGELPNMWAQFKALSHVPVLALRGENSDILSADTLTQMEAEHPRFTPVTLPDQGHAPFLDSQAEFGAIMDFLKRQDL